MNLRTDPRLGDRPPTHLIAHSGDRRTLCGQGDRHGPVTPYCLAKYAQAHGRGHDPLFCPDCVTQLHEQEP